MRQSDPDPSPSHAVHFYDSGRELQRRVGGYLKEGLESGESVIAICTAGARYAFAEVLRGTLADRDGERRYKALDSRALLPTFMKGQTPTWSTFLKTMAPLLSHASADGRPIRIYGDMVAQLWAAGFPGAALEVEEYLNRLASRYSFQLLCGYPLSLFRHRSSDLFLETCGTHDEIIVNAA
jgi:hypothetical protein